MPDRGGTDAVKRIALQIAAFVLPAAAYALVWHWTGPDTLDRIGYAFFVYGSLDETVNAIRINTIGAFFLVMMPVLVGLVGLGWARVFIRRRSDRPHTLR